MYAGFPLAVATPIITTPPVRTVVMEGFLDWLWASPPDETLRALGRQLEVGELPPGRVLVKESRARSVWLLPDLGGGLVLKHYRVTGSDAFKARLLPGRAESEFRSMEAFVRRGLPTVRPIAYADRRRGRRLLESWFLCRLVPSARTLGEAVEQAPDDEQRDALVHRALAVVAQMHAHPLYHRDLHGGNILLGPDDVLRIIDLHSVWRVPRLTARMRHANLARLLHSLRASVNLDRAAEFLQPYAALIDLAAPLEVERFAAGYKRFADDYERGRAARCMRNSTEFEGLRLKAEVGEPAEGRLHHLRRYEVSQLRADLTQHRLIDAHGGAALLGEQRRNSVTAVGSHVVKHYKDGGFYSRCRALLGLGRARGAWRAARRCDVVGLPTPTALALLECSDGTAFLVTEKVEGNTTLEEFLEPATQRDPAQRRAVADSIGHLLGVLARTGFRHSDLSTKNIMLTGEAALPTPDRRTRPPPGLQGLMLIDLDGARRSEPFHTVTQSRMLGQLMDVPAHVTRADRLRVSRAYAACAGRPLEASVLRRAEVLVQARVARRERLLSTRSGHAPGASRQGA